MRALTDRAVIAFPLDRVRPAASPAAAGPSAEVLIFTGVQVERMCDPAERLAPARLRPTSRTRGGDEFY